MTTVAIKVTPNAQADTLRILFTVRGHAEYSQDGNDIVCAAASMLAQSMMRWVQEHERLFDQIHLFRVDEGDVALDVEARSEVGGVVTAALSMVETGFHLLEEQYPGYVQFGGKGVSPD